MRSLPRPPTSRKGHVASLLKKKGDVGRLERVKHALNASLPALLRRYHVALSVTLAIMMLSLAWVGVIAAARTVERQAQTQSPTPDVQREREAEPAAPDISFIDSPSATCSRAVAGTNACTIEWNYFSVNAGSNYMLTMTVSIDGKIRANTQGFFQNSMYIPGDLLARGFQVDCGLPGASGDPALGQAHSYILRAKDSTGLSAANYGSVTCPSDIVPLAQLDLTGPADGVVSNSYSFDAFVFPITATQPITYTWLATDHLPQTLQDDVTNSRIFSWDTLGTKTITVEARNRSNVFSKSVTILIVKPIVNLSLNGPAVGTVNTSYSFDAAIFPITTTLPVTYTWLATDYPSQVVVDSLANSQTFSWPTAGTKTITVEARNRANLVSQSVTILIEPRKVYLPLIQR
jgi:hypothetical protein